MLRATILVIGFVLCAQAQTQLQLEAEPSKKVNVGQSVKLKVVDPPRGFQLKWNKETGHGRFDNGDSGPEVSFTPTTPGESVRLTCTASGAPYRPGEIYLDVASDEKSQSQVHGESVKPTSERVPTPPRSSPQPEHLPDNLVPINSTIIIDPSEGLVVPAGKMGDAESLGGPVSPLRPPNSCKYDDDKKPVECVLFEYDLARAHLGWAGLAWQVLPPNAKMNFGEFKGRNLSNAGYKSLRVWAKVQTGQERLRAEFKSGGNVAPEYAASNSASYVVSTGIVSVGQEWKEFCLDLPMRGDALKNVVSPFTVVVSGAYNPAERIGLAINAPSFSKESCPKKAR